jgi:hypothetical protein
MADGYSTDNSSQSHEDQLLAKITEKGGHAGNVSLQRALDWTPDLYWPIRNRLVDAGKIELARGKGGSVSLVLQPDSTEADEETDEIDKAQPSNILENELYKPVEKVLREEWAPDRRFSNCIVEVTARQGRRDTNGTWTRPDIVVAALRVFPHVLGKFFDLITFELKPLNGIDVTGVFEALSHRSAATQAYLWIHVPNGYESDDKLQRKMKRIIEEVQRHGIGLIVCSNPEDYDTWDIKHEASRVEPDPESLNEFIAQQLSDKAKDELALWFH